jgi:elongation of very long chain fatty acids protein 6
MATAQDLANFLYSIPYIGATQIEKDFTYTETVEFARENYAIPFTLVFMYLMFCFFGIKYLKDKDPFDLRYPLAMWSGALSLFSFIGMIKTVPFLLGRVVENTFEESICENPGNTWGKGPTGMWVMLFIFSKVPELIDTVFIVLRKKPLIFLHWYHHVTVLLYCWDAYATMAASGLWFVAMNYSVHAFMYGYYCLTSLKMCPKNFPTFLITFSQIAQMFVGTGVCISSWYYTLSEGTECFNSRNNLIAGGLMYGSYLYLFVDFAIDKFIRKKPKSASSKPASTKKPKKKKKSKRKVH